MPLKIAVLSYAVSDWCSLANWSVLTHNWYTNAAMSMTINKTINKTSMKVSKSLCKLKSPRYCYKRCVDKFPVGTLSLFNKAALPDTDRKMILLTFKEQLIWKNGEFNPKNQCKLSSICIIYYSCYCFPAWFGVFFLIWHVRFLVMVLECSLLVFLVRFGNLAFLPEMYIHV